LAGLSLCLVPPRSSVERSLLRCSWLGGCRTAAEQAPLYNGSNTFISSCRRRGGYAALVRLSKGVPAV
jgi:hypothetical protein